MNIIVLVSDTFRYDYLGCNGNAWIGTAALDRFAERAVCFDRHYCRVFRLFPTALISLLAATASPSTAGNRSTLAFRC